MISDKAVRRQMTMILWFRSEQQADRHNVSVRCSCSSSSPLSLQVAGRLSRSFYLTSLA